MNALALFLSPAGRLPPGRFAIAIVAVYLVGFTSQLLLSVPAVARGGLWAFAFAQAVLTWAWFALHAKRLRDAGRGTGVVAGIALVYALSVLLLLLVMAFLQEASRGTGATPSDPLSTWFALAYVFGLLYEAADLGALGIILVVLVLIALAPLVLALGFSIWAATRPRAPAPP